MNEQVFNAVRLERKNIDFDSDDKYVYVKGYACHFGEPNANGEIVTQDSFDNLFADMNKTGIMPAFNFMHRPIPVGVWDKIEPDETGLYVEGRLVKGSQFVRENVLPLLDAGACSYLSTEGYVYDGYNVEGDAYTYVATDFRLIRISLVDVPADFKQSEVNANAISLTRKKKDEHKHNRKIILY